MWGITMMLMFRFFLFLLFAILGLWSWWLFMRTLSWFISIFGTFWLVYLVIIFNLTFFFKIIAYWFQRRWNFNWNWHKLFLFFICLIINVDLSFIFFLFFTFIVIWSFTTWRSWFWFLVGFLSLISFHF